MSLSKDGMTGHPTEQDPDPGQRRDSIRGFNRWPDGKNTNTNDAEGNTRTVSDERRQQLAAANRERARRNARLKKLLEIYDVPRPAQVPGQKKELFSRYCKEKGCEVSKFTSLDSFAAHVVEQHGDPDKDKALTAMDDALEGDREETLAEDTAIALEQGSGPPGAGGGTPAGEVDYPVSVPTFDVVSQED